MLYYACTADMHIIRIAIFQTLKCKKNHVKPVAQTKIKQKSPTFIPFLYYVGSRVLFPFYAMASFRGGFNIFDVAGQSFLSRCFYMTSMRFKAFLSVRSISSAISSTFPQASQLYEIAANIQLYNTFNLRMIGVY